MFKKVYSKIQAILSTPIKNRFYRTAIPYFLFLAIGWTVIRECATVRYQFRKVKTLDREEIERLGIEIKNVPKTLEEMYEEYQKIDIDNWENVRGPRLFDETPSN